MEEGEEPNYYFLLTVPELYNISIWIGRVCMDRSPVCEMSVATIHVHKRSQGVIPSLPVGPIKPVKFDSRWEGEGESCGSCDGCCHLRCCLSGAEEHSAPVEIFEVYGEPNHRSAILHNTKCHAS